MSLLFIKVMLNKSKKKIRISPILTYIDYDNTNNSKKYFKKTRYNNCDNDNEYDNEYEYY